ncbi:MAG: hypothetical protein ABIQ65_04155, partial [Thermoanaerobaculia bacterium]
MAEAATLGAAYAGRQANHALSFRSYSASKHAQYFTPLWLADLLLECLRPLLPDGPISAVSVLDPTCGSGRLLAPWKAAGAIPVGVELDELAARHATETLGSAHVRVGDILDYRHLLSGFSLVLTNPPYGLGWPKPDPVETWSCETSGGLLESQGATLEICSKALTYGGHLVAILPSSTFENRKDRSLRDVLFTNFAGLLHITLPKLFQDEYGLSLDADLVVARREYHGSGDWTPLRATVGDDPPADLRALFARVMDTRYRIPASEHAPIPLVSRLFSVKATDAVRLTPKGVSGAADVLGMLGFLDETVTAFDPVRGIEHGIVTARLSPASLITLGADSALSTLADLGVTASMTEGDRAKLEKKRERFALLRTPIHPPRPHQCLAYIEDRPYEAKSSVKEGETALFTAGKHYHLRPCWVRNREVAKVEDVWDEAAGHSVRLTTSVDRGYLSFSVTTDSGPRVFREVSVEDVGLLTSAFELPVTPDLEAIVPRSVEHNRRLVEKAAPFLFPYQKEDVARMAVKPFGYLGYEQGGGKTVTAAAWASVRGFKRVLVVCQSSLVDNWLNELKKFGFTASRLTSHQAVGSIRAEKARKHLPATT